MSPSYGVKVAKVTNMAAESTCISRLAEAYRNASAESENILAQELNKRNVHFHMKIAVLTELEGDERKKAALLALGQETNKAIKEAVQHRHNKDPEFVDVCKPEISFNDGSKKPLYKHISENVTLGEQKLMAMLSESETRIAMDSIGLNADLLVMGDDYSMGLAKLFYYEATESTASAQDAAKDAQRRAESESGQKAQKSEEKATTPQREGNSQPYGAGATQTQNSFQEKLRKVVTDFRSLVKQLKGLFRDLKEATKDAARRISMAIAYALDEMEGKP